MQTLVKCASSFAIVFLISWLLSLYMRAKPWDQPKPPEPTIKPTRKTGREIFAKLHRRIGRKPFERN